MSKIGNAPKFKSEKQMFDWIWENREHKSELSGQKLFPKGHSQWHWQFLHILSKGTFPAYKLNQNNIILGTIFEHGNQNSYDKFNKKHDELLAQYYSDKNIKH